jgi:hypothetical protein
MPNGTTNWFSIPAAELSAILESLSGTQTIGFDVQRQPVSPPQILSFLRERRPEAVLINEQDHSWYIVQLEEHDQVVHGGAPPFWVAVSRGSPLFEFLQAASERAGPLVPHKPDEE